MKPFEKIPPDNLEENVLCRIKNLESALSSIKKSLAQSPEGTLCISKSNNSVQFYNRKKTPFGSSKKHYISVKNTKLLVQLAQKSYNLQIKPSLEKELLLLRQLLDFSVPHNSCSIFEKLPESAKTLVFPLTLPDDQYASFWQAEEYTKKGFIPGSREFYTAKGERVRSKSEVIIADTLQRYHVPYRYEYPLEIHENGFDRVFYPDFCCLNRRTHREFFWEHFGLLDEQEYSFSVTKKLNLYIQNKIFPGEKLLFTTETSESALNVKIVELLIKKYLL